MLRWHRLGGAGGFVLAGVAQVHPGAPAELHPQATGYDGQFVYRLALDPFTRAVTAHGMTLDLPAYRQQRIATALLAHLVAGLPGVGTALAVLLVNAAAVLLAIWVGTRIAADAARNPAWGLVLAVPAALPISLGRDLTEPVAWAGALCALYLVRHRRWPLAALALTVAILARETSLVFEFGLLGAAAWTRLRHRPADRGEWWLVAPLVVAGAWQGWLWHVWGQLPIRSGAGNTSGTPVLGIARSLFDGLTAPKASNPAIGTAFLVERLVTLGLLVLAAGLLYRRASRISLGEGLAWVLATILALSVRSWTNDVQFLRATYESWALSVYVLVQARERWATRGLAAAGAVTVLVAAMYVHLR